MNTETLLYVILIWYGIGLFGQFILGIFVFFNQKSFYFTVWNLVYAITWQAFVTPIIIICVMLSPIYTLFSVIAYKLFFSINGPQSKLGQRLSKIVIIKRESNHE